MSVRKAHNAGRNHLRNVVEYYQRMQAPAKRNNADTDWGAEIGHEKAQSVIDSITSSYAAEGQANPMLQAGAGGAFPPPPGFPGQRYGSWRDIGSANNIKGMPGMPPPFAMPGGQAPGPGIMPPLPGGRGMPFPPFPPNGLPPPGALPNGMPFPPPGGFPPSGMQFPPPGQFPPAGQGVPSLPGGPSPSPGSQQGGPPGYNMNGPPGMGGQGRRE